MAAWVSAGVLLALMAGAAQAQGPSPELQARFQSFAREACGGASGDLRGVCTDLQGPGKQFQGNIFQATFNVPSGLATLFGVTMCGVNCQVTCTVSRCQVSDQLGYFAPLNVPNPGLGNAPPPGPGDVEIAAATRDLIPDEVTSLGPAATRTGRTQVDALRRRGAALRAGASGVDVSGIHLRDSLGLLVSGPEMQDSYDRWALEALAEDGPVHAAQGSVLADPRLGVWANGFGEFGEFDGNGDEPAFDFDEAGLQAGVDWRFLEQTVVGAAFGWSDAELDFSGRAGQLDKESFSGSLYATHGQGPWYLDGAVSWHHIDYDLKRNIRLPFLTRTARGKPDGSQWLVAAGGGYDWSLGALTVGPHLRFEYIDLEIDGFSESGAGGIGFRFDSQDVESLQSRLGLDVRYPVSTGFGIVSPYARLDWVHEFLDDGRDIGASFLGDSQRTRFVLRVSRPDRDFAVAGAGVAITLAHGRSLFLDFEAPIGLRDTERYVFTAGGRLQF